MKKKFLYTFSPLLMLVLVGCQQKSSTAVDTATTRETNAAVANADNTALNKRDRVDATLTPTDQGNAPVDLEISQKIRKALVSGTTNYSVAAKNVKVITVNGKVTLRGPVQSAEEKTAVATLAKSVAGDNNVDDQLEVKGNPQ